LPVATTDRLSTQPMTTINDWRLLLERRLSSFRRRVEIPLELRLVSITATVVIALVAAGAQVANVIGAQQRQATTHTTIPDSWQPDGVCYAATTAPRMISFQELAQAQAPGVREIRPGVYHSCTLRGLTIPEPMVGAPSSRGQVILVSLSQQWLWAYRDGALVFANPVATGRDYLRTPLGVYQIDYKRADVTFYSPWPRSSPFYYSPEHINYALNFRAGGFYIHDAPWRQMFGPGAQDPHTTPNGAWETGSHGCVNMSTSAADWLYHWAYIGASVHIVE
jgi:lipoprotein-anchoring transpeptidase ErfK/SrfK